MQCTTVLSQETNVALSSLELTLHVTEANVLGYLAQFDDEETQSRGKISGAWGDP
jgi:hypothetical protein